MNREQFDSDEEMYFFWWLEELQSQGYIKEIIFQPKPFDLSKVLGIEYIKELKTKVKFVDEELMKGHIYTCDFFVVWNEIAIGNVTDYINSSSRKKKGQSIMNIICQLQKDVSLDVDCLYYFSFIEVKPDFDQNNMTRLSKINQKWVYDKLQVYVNIVKPMSHFKKTFTPERFLTTNKSGKPRKLKYEPTSLGQYLNIEESDFKQKSLF